LAKIKFLRLKIICLKASCKKKNMDSIRWARLELKQVLGIRIRRTRMFLGIPDPDSSVRGMDLDPDPDPSLFL
jgi:hypothetical protein